MAVVPMGAGAAWDTWAHPAICFQFPDAGVIYPPHSAAAGSACLKDYTLSELCRVQDNAFHCSPRLSNALIGKKMSLRDGWKKNIPQAEVSPSD